MTNLLFQRWGRLHDKYFDTGLSVTEALRGTDNARQGHERRGVLLQSSCNGFCRHGLVSFESVLTLTGGRHYIRVHDNEPEAAGKQW
jgi:hypothetical protein